MITVLIETDNDEEALARTLASLIGAAVEGMVRDVIVCDRGSTDQTHRVAEHAGCHFVADGGIAAGARQAKGEWVLLLEPGARLTEGWTESVLGHVTSQSMPARFSRRPGEGPPLLSRMFGGTSALSEGLLLRKGQAIALSKSATNAEAIARGLASKRLSAEIRAAPRPTRSRHFTPKHEV